MNPLSNVEFMLLQLLAEKGPLSGYEINQLVQSRGYREWAGIGTTSIYVSLEKLFKKSLVDSFLDTQKQGRGPLPKKFTINPAGKNVLKEEISKGLSSAREKDQRFNLALAAIPFLTQQEVITALLQRQEFLLLAAKNIENKFLSQGGKKLPLHVRILFEYPLSLINHEIKFTNTLISNLQACINKEESNDVQN